MITNPYSGSMTYAGGATPYGFGTYQPYPGTSASMPMPMPMPGTMPMQQAPMFAQPPAVPSGAIVTPTGGNIVTMPAAEESYIENILRLNRGKMATIYMTFENNSQWNAKVFKGVIEAAGRDHIIISDPATGMRYVLLMINLDYITFDEPIAYEYPFQGGVVTNVPAAQTGGGITG
jgi:spore germination protein Q